MALGEFSLIDRYFKKEPPAQVIGVGDDAAVLPWANKGSLVVCKDLLVQGRHFFADVAPDALGHKALAVNLSDLAAMGATPIGCLLGLGLPSVDEAWLEKFAAGFLALAQAHGSPLVGGDTVATNDGLFISVTAFGHLPDVQPGLLRRAACVDDRIWVSGNLGAADLALKILQGTLIDEHGVLPQIRQSLEWPEPRVSLGQRLLGVAHAAIDISDGLVQDLGHLLDQSGVGAVLEIARLPAHPSLINLSPDLVGQAMLGGGDAYELCFTAPASRDAEVRAIGRALDLPLTCIGYITAERQLMGLYPNGQCGVLSQKGFDHFAGERS